MTEKVGGTPDSALRLSHLKSSPPGRERQRSVLAGNSLQTPRTLVWWLLFGVACNAAGWGLSALHFLNATGYAAIFFLAVLAVLLFRRPLFTGFDPTRIWRRTSRHFRHPLSAAFYLLALLGFIGGLIYAPNNFDALSYRLPRVLHWLAEGRWHWIHTEFQRVNARGCGYEWVSAPLLALTHTDRFLFLLNSVSFCFLPGLVFSTLLRLGVSARAAWAWMWILPTGYCFLLQSGSIANDLFGATFVLAAVNLALRARESGNASDLWLSMLAAGLFTAVKANNLPLLLVWAAIAACSWRIALRHPAGTVAVALVALSASFLPTALLNRYYSDDWTGAKAEQLQFRPPNLWARPLGNLGRLAVDSFFPPINPFSHVWNDHVAGRLAPRSIDQVLTKTFLSEGPILGSYELQTEEGAGLGVGVCGLLVLSLAGAFHLARSERPIQFNRLSPLTGTVVVTSFIAFAAFLQASFVASTPRLAMAYYPFLALPLLLHPAHGRVVRKTWWTILAMAACLLAMLVMILSPARPLFPVKSFLAALPRLGFPSKLVARAERVYSVYGERANAFKSVIEFLPPGTKTVGLVTFDDPEAALWKPLGSRRVIHVCANDSRETLAASGLRYILVNPQAYAKVFPVPYEEWVSQMNAEIVQTFPLSLRAGNKTALWQLLQLR